MNIDAIRNGIVIDHIQPGKAMQIYEMIGLDKLKSPVALIMNVQSAKMGRKDIIKIDQHIELDLDVLGYISPHITVDIVKDGKVVSKKHIELPEQLTDILFCRNPRCITSTEQEIHHRFRLTDRKNGVYRCIYCDTAAK